MSSSPPGLTRRDRAHRGGGRTMTVAPETKGVTVHLDLLSPSRCQVGYGELGMRGDLGYEGKRVVARGVPYAQALSTHAPARVLYDLDGRYSRLRCAVALNDDVPAGRSHAHFAVRADGVLV